MPLTSRGVFYLFALVAVALAASYIVIELVGITEANLQYDVSISMIVLFLGLFFTKNNVMIGLALRAFWSCIVAGVFFLLLRAIDLL
jgi:hypothetical protein